LFLNRGLSIDASCKMFLYLAKWFQRSRGSKIDQPEKELPMVAIFVNIPSINTSYQDPVYLEHV
jgi:hypothetical protein